VASVPASRRRLGVRVETPRARANKQVVGCVKVVAHVLQGSIRQACPDGRDRVGPDLGDNRSGPRRSVRAGHSGQWEVIRSLEGPMSTSTCRRSFDGCRTGEMDAAPVRGSSWDVRRFPDVFGDAGLHNGRTCRWACSTVFGAGWSRLSPTRKMLDAPCSRSMRWARFTSSQHARCSRSARSK